MVRATIQQVDPDVPVKLVTASRGKAVRAEPVAAKYEQHRVHHVGEHARLEEQMCGFVPGDMSQASPDRMDALVWALTELMLGGAARVYSSVEPVTGEPPVRVELRRGEHPSFRDERDRSFDTAGSFSTR